MHRPYGERNAYYLMGGYAWPQLAGHRGVDSAVHPSADRKHVPIREPDNRAHRLSESAGELSRVSIAADQGMAPICASTSAGALGTAQECRSTFADSCFHYRN